MKKILSWCGSHTELLCAFFLLGCCINSAVKDGWSVAILFLPFIAMWVFTYRLQKEFFRLTKKNKELEEANKQLEKAYKENVLTLNRIEDIKTYNYYKYLMALNDVNLCKKIVDCNTYLARRRRYEDMIAFYVKKLTGKDIQ